MTELIWPATVLLVAAMALWTFRQATSPAALVKRLAAAEAAMAQLPAPEAFLGRIDALEKALEAAASPVKMVGIVNAHTRDLLELKGIVAELRTSVLKMRTGESLRLTATGG